MLLVSQEAVVQLLTKVATLRPSKMDKPKLRRPAMPLLSRAVKPRLPKGVLLPRRRQRREDKVKPPKEEPPPPPQTKMARAKLLREPLLRLSRVAKLRRLKERMPPLLSKARKVRLPKLVLLVLVLLRRREPKARLLREQMLLLLIRVLKHRQSKAREPPMQHRSKETQLPTEVFFKAE